VGSSKVEVEEAVEWYVKRRVEKEEAVWCLASSSVRAGKEGRGLNRTGKY
jgi:hypothetical protein